jgi:sensor c-di-GMP phosphodiesterase-like protein
MGPRDLLRAIGCDIGQGYIFGRAVPVDAIMKSGPGKTVTVQRVLTGVIPQAA